MGKIIYIEDNPDTAEAVRIILTKAGHIVDTALTGQKGLDMIEAHSYDLILLDIMLPDMSGWDIYEKLKGRLRTKFAFLSAIPVSSERMEQLKKQGVSDYIVKPFARDDLVSRINNALAR